MRKRQQYIAIERSKIVDSKRFYGGLSFMGGELPSPRYQFRKDLENSDYLPLDAAFLEKYIAECAAEGKSKTAEEISKEIIEADKNGEFQILPLKEYYIFPVVSEKDEWAGDAPLKAMLDRVKLETSRWIVPMLTTMAMPQLRHHDEVDRIALISLGGPDFRACQQVMGDDLTLVDSLDDLFLEFRRRLPDEPPNVTISEKLKDMLSDVPEGPLNGTIVVAFDQQIAGSLAAEELARAGATVIKVEKNDGKGDPKAQNSTPTAYNTFNAGKHSITFSDSDEDQKLKAELLSIADVVIDNRSQAAQQRDKKLQGALQSKERLKPLIFCSISGFGRDSKFPAYDRVVQAGAGMADLNGKLIPFPLIDMATGKEAAHAITQNLFYRERMTPNQLMQTPTIRLDVSMAATALNMMANPIATYIDTGKTESTIVPFDLYDAQDGKIAVAIATDEQYQRLCDLIEQPSIKQYTTNDERQKHRAEIEAAMQESLKTKTVDKWLEAFAAHNIAAQPVLSIGDAITRHGRDIIKPTKDGSLMVSSPTTSNIFPRTPHIGPAPKYNADKDGVAELVQYMGGNKNKRALRQAIQVADERPVPAFQQNYRFVDVKALDFSQAESNVDWAKGKIFSIKKTGLVKAEQVKLGTIVNIVHNRDFVQPVAAMEGDYKVTTSFGDCYLQSKETFERNYLPVEDKPGTYMPNPELKSRKAVQVTEDVRFVSPSGDTNYIPEGGWVVEGTEGPYGIHPNNIEGNYEVMSWVDRAQSVSQGEGTGRGGGNNTPPKRRRKK